MSTEDFLSEKKQCPVCQEMTTYGEMIWLDGVCMCPRCYAARKRDIERIIENDESAEKNWNNGW